MREPKPILESDVWAALDDARNEYLVSTKRKEGGVSIAEYAQRYGIIETTARAQLDKMERNGKLTSERVRETNAKDGRDHFVRIYYPVKLVK